MSIDAKSTPDLLCKYGLPAPHGHFLAPALLSAKGGAGLGFSWRLQLLKDPFEESSLRQILEKMI